MATLALVALMAYMPNTAPQAGDHESTTCGNAFTIEMGDPRPTPTTTTSAS